MNVGQTFETSLAVTVTRTETGYEIRCFGANNIAFVTEDCTGHLFGPEFACDLAKEALRQTEVKVKKFKGLLLRPEYPRPTIFRFDTLADIDKVIGRKAAPHVRDGVALFMPMDGSGLEENPLATVFWKYFERLVSSTLVTHGPAVVCGMATGAGGRPLLDKRLRDIGQPFFDFFMHIAAPEKS